MARNYFTFRSSALSVLGPVGLGALLFIPAGTLNYWQAWVFIVVFAAATQAIGIYLTLKDPALLERRLQFGPGAEQRPSQRIISALVFVGLLAVMVVSALDYRFRWSTVQFWASLLGDVLVVLSLFITVLVPFVW
jgi:protein-S-isoprenylcysteine O-methyltransferase Ste14